MERLTTGIYTFQGKVEDVENEYIVNVQQKLKEYEDLEEQGMLLRVPQIKKGKTIYWIWGDEIMPCIFVRITSCIVDDSGRVHIMCEMRTKKDRTFISYGRRKTEETIKAGDTRYFYADDIGKTVFLTSAEAKEGLKKIKETEE